MDNNFENNEIFDLKQLQIPQKAYFSYNDKSPCKHSFKERLDLSHEKQNKVYPATSTETTYKNLTFETNLLITERSQQFQNERCALFSGVCNVQIKNKGIDFNQEIMKTKQIRKIKKNGNLPKFVCRFFIDNYLKYDQVFNDDPELKKEMKNFMKEKKALAKKDKNYYYSRKHMGEFFGIKKKDPKGMKKSFLCRKIMNQILGKEMLKIIQEKPRLRHSLKSYILALKVLKQRTRNVNLIKRLQYK